MTENERSPEFSIIIASYLSNYKDCATYREQKFIRAVDSCLNQTFKDFEIIIVADGCLRTKILFDKYYSSFEQVKLVEIPKQIAFSGKIRNAGIDNATGRYITYLDTDDKLGRNHLQIIADNLAYFDWVYYDDYLMQLNYKPKLNVCELKSGKCGTSNVTHKRFPEIRWNHSGYAKDDLGFIGDLKKMPNHGKIVTPEYFICHQPRRVDV
jgi:glycosyltransferase involved in cell wall biosynthesis